MAQQPDPGSATQEDKIGLRVGTGNTDHCTLLHRKFVHRIYLHIYPGGLPVFPMVFASAICVVVERTLMAAFSRPTQARKKKVQRTYLESTSMKVINSQ